MLHTHQSNVSGFISAMHHFFLMTHTFLGYYHPVTYLSYQMTLYYSSKFHEMERMFVEFNYLIFKIENFRYDKIRFNHIYSSINDSSDDNVAADI